MNEGYLKEKVVLFLFALSKYENVVNRHTFERYIYLYFFSLNFFASEHEEKSDGIVFSRHTGNIVGLEDVYSDLGILEYIQFESNDIIIQDKLINFVNELLVNKAGQFFYEYQEIQPFVNLLKSYTDEYVFTIFFSEPTQKGIEARNLDSISLNSSILVKLLSDFKKKIKNRKIDDYDILTHWMNFVLKEYYNLRSDSHD